MLAFGNDGGLPQTRPRAAPKRTAEQNRDQSLKIFVERLRTMRGRPSGSPAENFSENEWCNDRGIRFDDESWGIDA
jgi:hypothetical protein